MSDNIKVVVKVRPLISREIEDKLTYHWRVKNNTLYQLDTNGKELGQAFTFDKVYDDDTKTSDVYNDIAKPIVEAATAGFNGTIFAYGQTSSGKTYTMTGTDSAPGIIPLAVLNLFEIIKNIPDRDFLVRVSYMEIYNETVKDLLNVENNNIKVQETLQGIKVDVTEKVTSSPEEVLEAMKEGEANRQTGATNMNEQSSRSHSIFQITIESREHIEGDSEGGCVNVSQLNLVDLAGSERAGQTGATGIRFKEGTHINKSLSSLALVIKQLSEDPKKHVNYRDSKLTRILQNSLGGNAKTSIICAVTPVAVEETISTLQFANRAKAIKNKPEVNAVATDATMIQRLTKQMSKLQSQLESKKNLEQDNFNLQKQITALQRLILNGFHQRRSIDMMQGRRKLQQLPRRVTIHSTVSELESEPVVKVPKFCTPSLKYNPSLLQNTSDFVPIHTANKLPSVPEEPARLITPPPRRTVNFSNEVINLDSDDDTTQDDHETCSPIHKCYGSSKTPPCILRKNCKIAEKNLKDIVELTEREKIFSPSAVELMEKLEENATIMASLQDEIELMRKTSKDKDLQNDILKTKLEKKETELKLLSIAKDDLQNKCESYSIKLTELEVIYETFKTKAKLREEELLSLLDEVKVKQPLDIGKLTQNIEKDIPFMDISKDISLVNSDNENSIAPDDETEDINNIITDTQKQLASKSQSLVELEEDLFAHKKKIASLESLIQEREHTLSTFMEKLSNVEIENALLKSSIENLNTTINNQKENLLTAKKDIESYNSVIQELKVKLSQKEHLSAINIDDSVLESMITSEEHFIANNENIMNIIHSFKLALDMRNKQIAELKNNEKDTEIENLLNQLQTRTEQISVLNSTLDGLKKNITDNVSTIRKLMREKEDFKVLEQELVNELAELRTKNNELEKIITDNSYSQQNLKEEINRLKLEYTNSNTQKIADLTVHLREKDDLIVSLNKDISQFKEILCKANITVLKSLSILGTLTDNVQEMPEITDNYVNIFHILSNSLNTLDIAASNIVSEKEELNQTIVDLKADLKQLQIDHTLELTSLQNKIEEINKNENDFKQENDSLKSKLNEAIEIRDLEISINVTKQYQLQQSLAEKDGTINNLTTHLKLMENQFKDGLSKINDLESQLKNAREEKHNLLRNLFKQITNIAIKFNIENFSHADLVDSVKIYEHTLLTLENIANHITFISMKNVDHDNIMAKTYNSISQPTETNCDLTNSTMPFVIDKNRDDNLKKNEDLKINPQILQDLQTELENKAMQLNFMEEKVLKWKKQFESLDFMMKQQIEDLKIENENLKTRIQNLETEQNRTSIAVDDYAACDIGNSNRLHNTISQNEVVSPPSLVKICCEKIVDSMELQTRESKSTIINVDVENDFDVNQCTCYQLKLDLEVAREENSRLLESLAEMEVINQCLLEEQDIVRSEIQLLLEPAQELQKKIINHRTNLSILTATTYAENKSLKSQVKVLQHHHKRFHNVCQRDIPDVKKQLCNLMSLLKGDPSVADQQNLNFKRYSLPDALDNSTTPPNFKNESTLDGDLLMLDTNVTITTAGDNTLTGHDQTCLDMTLFYTEASSQTNDINQVTDANIQQVDILDRSTEIYEKLNLLKGENVRLQALVNKYSQMKPTALDPQNNDSKSNYHFNIDNGERDCDNCKELAKLKESHDIVNEKLKDVTEHFIECKSLKAEMEQKYNNLILERTTMDARLKKLSIFEKEFNSQKEEISKMHNAINIKNKELKSLQEENDTLSNQLMDSVSEVDNLTKALQNLKQQNNELEIKCSKLEQSTQYLGDKEEGGFSCEECVLKDKLIQVMQSKETRTHAKLNRSLSDSDTLSRCNKICTLQSELHAGREDCKELTEDVVTIKNHLERSNISMDLDESLIDNNICPVPKDYEVPSPQSSKCSMPDIPEERTTDIYMMDKMECLNYYMVKIGVQQNSLSSDSKIIEIMKMLYENLIIKHSNEIENLSNKLKDYDETKIQLRSQYNDLTEKYSQITKELEDKNNKYASVDNSLSRLRTIINIINEELRVDVISNAKLMTILKEPLIYLDSEFDISSIKIFEYFMEVVNKNQSELSDITEKYTKLQKHMETVTMELDSVNNSLSNLKSQLSSKEKEYDLLKVQKERVFEITNAVTLDIVKREKELKDTIDKGYRRLMELDIVNLENLDSNLPLNTNINTLFDLLVTKDNRSRHNRESKQTAILLEINSLKQDVEEKQKQIETLKIREAELREVNNGISSDLVCKDNQLQTLTKSHEDLIKIHENTVRENKSYTLEIEKLTTEVNILKTSLAEKEHNREILETDFQMQYSKSVSEISDLVEAVNGLQSEIINLKRLNDMIKKEKDSYAEELKKSAEAIQKNNIDIDKMTSDILVLRESVKDNGIVIENLRTEAKSLLKLNMELKEQLEKKIKECSRLETNIKTHEKTAQIQTRMIMRIEKQKGEDDKKLEELTQKYMELQKECEISKTEIEQMKNTKDVLQARVTELETSLEAQKNRPCIDGVADSSRHRRRSIHDSKRIFADEKYDTDHQTAEAVFGLRAKPEDLFEDGDNEASNRSTPTRHSKGRDSLSLSRADQSDKDDEQHSRPSSVLDSRRRRQTLYDSLRSELSQTPPPGGDNDSSVSQLREQLTACQQELDDLKEKYRELDEECETCSQYLREREDQCSKLKKEKMSLQNTITELKGKLHSYNPSISQMNALKPKVTDASVNTDEDWANLHSVVVDRMSYDAEVEKNKKLTKTIEELRFKKQDLKNTLAKMQKALERNVGNRELEATKSELQSCKQELSELKQRYKELDEECETCAQYLRDKEDQCRRLKEAKTQLEAKLQELQADANPIPHTSRKKRQTAHDQNRASTVDVLDAAAETSEDLLSYQVERDSNVHALTDEKHSREVKHLKLAVERLSQQKSMLEQQLAAFSGVASVHAPTYVATGSAIVQNQQITDVMKENHKLKKINAKLINMCKKRGKESNRENEDPADQG